MRHPVHSLNEPRHPNIKYIYMFKLFHPFIFLSIQFISNYLDNCCQKVAPGILIDSSKAGHSLVLVRFLSNYLKTYWLKLMNNTGKIKNIFNIVDTISLTTE